MRTLLGRVLVEIHYPDGNNSILGLDLYTEILMVGEGWRPGVVSTANYLDHYGDEIAYAINEGGVVAGNFDPEDAPEDDGQPVRWTVCTQSLDLLRQHGVIQ